MAAHRGHGAEALVCNLLQLDARQAGEVLVEGLQGRLADDMAALAATDHIEDHPVEEEEDDTVHGDSNAAAPGDELDPDGEVVHAGGALAHARPHVQPGVQRHRVHHHLAGGEWG